MKDSVERLAFLLAASGLNEKTIRDGVKELRHLNFDAFLQKVLSFRRQLGPDSELDEQMTVSPRGRASVTDRERAAEFVAHLLLREANLKPAEASKLLMSSLFMTRASGIPKDVRPYRPKEGFRSWVKQLPVVPSELLHHATKIRNEIVHSPVRAWPLRSREE